MIAREAMTPAPLTVNRSPPITPESTLE